MGWEISFMRYKKYKDTTPNQIRMIERILDWETNYKNMQEWYQKNGGYEYYKEFHEIKEVPQDAIDFYKKFYKEDESNTYIMETLGFFCREEFSYKWFAESATDLKEGYYFSCIADKDLITKFIKYCLSTIEENYPKPVYVKTAFIECHSDEDGDYTKLIHCDGVELTKFDGEDYTQERIYSDQLLFYNRELSYYEDSDVLIPVSLCKLAIEILTETDWDNEGIYITVG